MLEKLAIFQDLKNHAILEDKKKKNPIHEKYLDLTLDN